jgi:glycine/D-amino acid oxidase-like deaminating enzyme
VPDVLEEVGWTGGECITDCRTMLHYFRTTPDGRIAFGLGGGRVARGGRLHGRVEVDPEVIGEAADRLRAYFPTLEGRRLTHAWGGPIDVSPTHLPVVVPLDGGRALVAAGYTGNGVGPSHLGGKILASLALHADDGFTRLGVVTRTPKRFPPEPLRSPGVLVANAAIRRKDDLEDAERPVDPITRFLARLPRRLGYRLGPR